jgi:chaperonin GroEL (HSP60 family)
MEYNPNPNAKFSKLLSSSIIEEKGDTKTISTTITENKKEKLQDVMKDLEYKVNPKSIEEGIDMLVTTIQTNKPSTLLSPIEAGAKEFQERVGRPMTYGEMRAMWG